MNNVCPHGMGEGYFCRPCAERYVAVQNGKTFTKCTVCIKEFDDDFPHMIKYHMMNHEDDYICTECGNTERDHNPYLMEKGTYHPFTVE